MTGALVTDVCGVVMCGESSLVIAEQPARATTAKSSTRIRFKEPPTRRLFQLTPWGLAQPV